MKKFSILSLFTFMIFSCSTDSNYFADAENKDASLITYSFYMNNSSSQAWATISGENGSSVPLIVEPKKANYKFSQWKTANGTPVPQSFGSENLSFFASWESDAGNMLGTKSAPDSLYDIIFTDGSAIPYPADLDSLTADQAKNVVAMLYTTTYNPNNGSNTDGKYRLAAGFPVNGLASWCEEVITIGTSQFYNTMYIGYVFEDTANNHNLYHSVRQLSPYYGLSNYADSENFYTLVNSSYCPAFYYAANYGVTKCISADCRSNWYLPSTGELKVLLKNTEICNKYKLLFAKLYSSSIDYFLKQNKIWTSTSDTSQESGSIQAGEPGDKVLDAKERPISVFDVFLNKTGKITVYLNSKYENSKYNYSWSVYDKAYYLDCSGNQHFEKRSYSCYVIPVRIF